MQVSKSNSPLSAIAGWIKNWIRAIGIDQVKKALKAYFVFAALHSLWKLWLRQVECNRFVSLTKHLPGMKPDFMAKELKKNFIRMHDWNTEVVLPHSGKPLVQRSSGERLLVCNTRETVRFILKDDFQNFTKPSPEEDPLFDMLDRFLGKGIFVVRHGIASQQEHDVWFKQRKIASRIFTKNLFNKLAHETFVEKANNMIRLLTPIAEQNTSVKSNRAQDGATIVDMQEKFFSYTFDSIQRIFFGKQVDSIMGSMDPYANAFDEAHRSMMRYLHSTIAPGLLSRYVLPYPFGAISPKKPNTGLMGPLMRATNPHFANFQKNVDFLTEETLKIVEEMRKDPNLEEREDLMSNFLKANKLSKDYHLSDVDLRDLILNFIIAGRDTTACTLSWMFYELSINPDVQNKLAEELDSVLCGKTPTLEELDPSNLPYLTGVLYETLRLHPAVPFDLKVASRDVVFPDGTCVPEGTKCAFLAYSLGRDPKRYPNPDKFDPTRWMPFKIPDPFEFPVFQAGPRLCLGQAFAIFEAKLLASILLQRFNFSLKEGESIFYSFMVTMSISNDEARESNNLWLVPRLRKEGPVSLA